MSWKVWIIVVVAIIGVSAFAYMQWSKTSEEK